MTPRDLADRFLGKTAQDETLLDKVLDDAEVSDEVIGFHCQQAAEKLLKAVLIHAGIQFRRTHDLAELVQLLEDHHISLPEFLANLDTLTPFAVEYRYDFLGVGEASSFDRKSAKKMVAILRQWAEGQIQQEEQKAEQTK